MQRLDRQWETCVLLALVLLGVPATARPARAAGPQASAQPQPAAAVTAENRGAAPTTPPAGGPAPASVEDQLQHQTVLLRQLQDMLLTQQAELERLRAEVDLLRAAAPAAPETVSATSAPPAAPTAAPSAPPSAPLRPPSPQDTAGNAGDDLKKQVGELTRRWGNIRLSGDLRLRAESFFNQGFDAPADLNARHRLRVRARAQIAGDLGRHFDWGLRLASGSFTDPTSTNQTLTDAFGRKAFGIDRAFLHFSSRTEPAALDVWAGKFETPWKRTSLTFDPDVQPEGLAQAVSVDVGKGGPLRTLRVVAWQLPLREQSLGADAYIYGGQVLLGWKVGDHWGASVSGTFHDFEQIDLIAPILGVPNTQVGGGLELNATNVVVVNPLTNRPEFRSQYRVVDTIAEVTYDALGGSTKWPLAVRANWVRNTSAYNNQKDGGTLTGEVGRATEEKDWLFAYTFWKAEREMFPSIFMESDVGLQTNSVAHLMSGSYMVRRNVQVQTNYYLTRRLQTVAAQNRWLNRFQFDVIYKF